MLCCLARSCIISSWSIRDLLDRLIPARLLLSAEIGRREDFLHTQNLHARVRRVGNHRHMLFDVESLDLIDRRSVGAAFLLESIRI